jgi:hypothetical protein
MVAKQICHIGCPACDNVTDDVPPFRWRIREPGFWNPTGHDGVVMGWHVTTQERTSDMMNGYGMGFGGIWMIVILILVGLMIAALIKYLRK